MENREVIPFYGLLNMIIDDIESVRDSSKSTYLSKILEEKGVAISSRSIQRYRIGVSVPSLDLALKIMDVLGVEFSAEYIQNCLQEGKKFKEKDTIKKSLSKKITINTKDFDIGIDNIQELITLIEDRVSELYPDKNNSFSFYVEKLIEKDLLENIFEKEA